MVIRIWRILATFSILSSLGAIASPALSEPTKIDLFLSPNSNQPYENVVEEAETVATISIDQELSQSPETTQIYLRVFGDVKGQIVPVLFSKVSRSDWQQDPRIHRWTRYFITSGLLLGFDNSSVSPTNIAPTRSRIRLEDDPGFRDD
jgi:hypothetical protein